MKTVVRIAALMLAAAVQYPALSSSTAAGESVAPDVVERSISSMAARRMVDACLAFAAARGWKMQLAVVDRSGALVAFGRSDGATSGSQDISLAKARTAARFGWSTEEFARHGWPTSGHSPGPLAFVPGMIGIAGGLPIFTPAGDHIGGIGVSGALPANDVECAKAATEKAGVRHSFP